jgi:hypothetical protein
VENVELWISLDEWRAMSCGRIVNETYTSRLTELSSSPTELMVAVPNQSLGLNELDPRDSLRARGQFQDVLETVGPSNSRTK